MKEVQKNLQEEKEEKEEDEFDGNIEKMEETQRVYKKEEKDLVSLKNDLYNKKQGGSQINEK